MDELNKFFVIEIVIWDFVSNPTLPPWLWIVVLRSGAPPQEFHPLQVPPSLPIPFSCSANPPRGSLLGASRFFF